jgi:DNA modification methylase
MTVGSKLNDLGAKEWVKSTKSWFIVNPHSRKKKQLIHPAKFPEELVERFVSYFTISGAWILDPFAGVGSTMIACKNLNRNSVGIELNPSFVNIGREELERTQGDSEHHILVGDSFKISEILEGNFSKPPAFDFLITSPPYWNMLRKSRGYNDTVHKERAESGLPQYYSDFESDIGNIESYTEYIECLGSVIDGAFDYLAKGAYLTIVVQNMRDVNGELRPIAWDIATRLSNKYMLRQEQIWCQDNKRLGCWGYPTTYVSNVHHHYCIILQKPK